MTDEKKSSTLTTAAGRWRDKLLDAAVITIPTALITQSVSWVQGRFFAQAWQILWIALPLALCALVAWRLLRRPGARRIEPRFALFLFAYASVFSIASATNVLVWHQKPVAEFADVSDRPWLLPVTFGDWRYHLLPDEAVPPGLTVLLIDHHETQAPALKRVFDAQIIQAAVRDGAKGVFFDIAYPHASPMDPVLCATIDQAVAAPLPVATVYSLTALDDDGKVYVPDKKTTDGTPGCLLEHKGRSVLRAHSMVLADADGTVRSVPFEWTAAPGHVPLSLRIAQVMHGEDKDIESPGKLVRFARADAGLQTISGDDRVRQFIGAPGALTSRFLLVGERSKSDQFKTPWGDATPGVLLHAYAASTLLANHSIVRPPAWFSAFIVVAACAILALFTSQDASALKLTIVTAAMTVAVFALSALAIAVMRVWLDVIYSVVAMWLLLPLLFAYRRFRTTASLPPAAASRAPHSPRTPHTSRP